MMHSGLLAAITDPNVLLTFLILIVVFIATVAGIYLAGKRADQAQKSLKRIEDKLEQLAKPR